MSTHKAYRLHSYGGPECVQLDDIQIPEVGPTQVLVAVKGVGMNPFDWKIREGYVKDHWPLPLPTVIGTDFVGTIVNLGPSASRFKVGDRVMSFSKSLGAFAEHIAAEEGTLAHIPASMDFITAATLPMPGLSAWQSLNHAGSIKPGMKILVHGASGIVGAFAVQFAKDAGAYVIGTASGKNREYVLSLGADEFIDYQTQRFEDLVNNVDLILDYVLVGGAENTTNRSWSVLNPNGAIVSLADPGVLANIPDGFRGYFIQTDPIAEQLELIAEQVADSKISSKLGRVFSRNQLVKAMEVSQVGGTTGRLVVDFTKSD